MDELLADFLTETGESLAELDVALIKLERAPDDAPTLSLIFRMVHTIKGTCGFLGLPRLERVAHAGENVLGRVRDGVLVVTPELVSAVLAAIDRIKLIVAGLGAAGTEPAGDDTALIGALNAICEGRAEPVAVVADAVAIEPVVVVADVVAIGPVAIGAAVAEPVAAEPVAEAAGEPVAIAAQTIRVGVDVLEELMTLVSELVLTRNQLLQLDRTQAESPFAVPLQRLSHITSDLQEGVMKTRMQPIGMAWNKLPRLVRDLGRDLGKRIELVMLGAETELDRQVLELIKDPLTHMVRNSADHGLETGAERLRLGKPEVGHITLNAFHEGGHIMIEIADDGQGLPVERIRARILSKGMATQAELDGMDDMQIQRFILRPGFSTAAAVTAVSGRGVGMDVVKTNIERIGGTIALQSVAGQGTKFVIKIPLTLAIVSALIVEAGGERFAIPQLSVVELVRAGHGGREGGRGEGREGEPAIERIGATPVLRLRQQLLPLVNLGDLLELGDGGGADAAAGLHIVVAQVGTATLGIIVDRVFDIEEIVVKPVTPLLRDITMFSGNTILGDGSVIMILDPNGIARACGLGGESEGRAIGAAAAAGEAGRRSGPGSGPGPRTAMLLFRAGGEGVKAVRLELVARLEDVPRARIESAGGRLVTQYRGRLMTLLPLSGGLDESRERHCVLVFGDGAAREPGEGAEGCVGLVVEEILDVVEDRLEIELACDQPGLLGTAVIAGRATDMIDTAYWLEQARGGHSPGVTMALGY